MRWRNVFLNYLVHLQVFRWSRGNLRVLVAKNLQKKHFFGLLQLGTPLQMPCTIPAGKNRQVNWKLFSTPGIGKIPTNNIYNLQLWPWASHLLKLSRGLTFKKNFSRGEWAPSVVKRNIAIDRLCPNYWQSPWHNWRPDTNHSNTKTRRNECKIISFTTNGCKWV